MLKIDLNHLTTNQAIRLNEISRNMKVDFNNLTEDIINSADKSLVWLLHPLVSRNMYLSNLYLNICQLLLIKQILYSNPELSRVVVKSKDQKKILGKYINTSGKTVIEISNNNRNNFKNSNIYHLLKIGYKTIKMVYSSDKRRKIKAGEKAPITILDTFLTKKGLKEGKYHDRYYNGLLDHIPKDEASLIYWLPTILGKFKRKEIKKIYESSDENLLFKQDYLKWTDYIWSLYQMLRLRKPEFKNLYFYDIYISDLVSKEFKLGKINSSVYEGMLNYRFMKRLSDAGVKVHLVVDWNENQPIDKGLIKGVKDYYPTVKIKGYQGYIISTDYNFYISPTDYELKWGIIPDEICVVGNKFRGLISQFSDKVKVVTAPAFRFDYLLENRQETKHSGYEIKATSILMLLPIGLEEIDNILETCYQALGDLTNNLNPEILVKPHPLVDKKKILDSKFWRESYSIIEGNFSDVIRKVDLLIGNSSSTLVESLFNGVPVIIIGSTDRITQNPIPPFLNKKLWRVVYDGRTTSKTILEFLDLISKNKEAIIEEMNQEKGKYIEAVNKDTVKHFLDL